MPIHSISHNGSVGVADETIAGAFNLTGEQAFSTTGTSNDVTLNAGVSVFRYTGNGAGTITGFTGGTSGRVLVIINESLGSAALTLSHLTGSTVANQIIGLSTGNISISYEGGAVLRYDGAISRWRLVTLATTTYNTLVTGAAGVTSSGSFTASSIVTYTSVTSSSSISGTNNDWAPTAAFRQRIAASAAATITGLSTNVSGGRLTWLQNISAFNVTLSHEGAGSTAANRFTCPMACDLVIPPGGNAYVIYDTTTSRWIVFGDTSCTSTQTVFSGATQSDTSTGTVNDFALSASATILRCNPGSAVTFNGLAGGVDGRLIIIWNVAAFNVTLANEAGASTAANRITLPQGGEQLVQGDSALLIYDGTSSRWRVLRGLSRTHPDAFLIQSNLTVNGNTRLGDQNTDTVGFYTTAGSAQQAMVVLTDNTAGTANSTLEALTSGTVYSSDVAAIRNNFADLAAKVNEVRTILLNLGIIA